MGGGPGSQKFSHLIVLDMIAQREVYLSRVSNIFKYIKSIILGLLGLGNGLGLGGAGLLGGGPGNPIDDFLSCLRLIFTETSV